MSVILTWPLYGGAQGIGKKALGKAPVPTVAEVQHPGSGLFWMRCPLGQTWSGSACTGNATLVVLAAAQSACPGGYRLPVRDEAMAMLGGCPGSVLTGSAGVCSTCSASPICGGLFGAGATGEYWSSSAASSPSASAAKAWGFSLGYGTLQLLSTTSPFGVRCVRFDATAGPAPSPSSAPARPPAAPSPSDPCRATTGQLPQPLPTVSPDHPGADTTQDAWQPSTGLCWLRCPAGQLWNGATCTGARTRAAWNNARTSCPAGYRLPTRAEYATLLTCGGAVEKGGNPGTCTPCAANGACKTQVPSDWSWTSSPLGSDYAWVANTSNGYLGWTLTGYTYGLQCVRSPGVISTPVAAGPQPTSPGAYNAAAEVALPSTKLYWLRCPLGQQWATSTTSLDIGMCSGARSELAWTGAQHACPAGFRLPTKEELMKVLCSATFGGCSLTFDPQSGSGSLTSCAASGTCSAMFKDDLGRYWSSDAAAPVGGGPASFYVGFTGNVARLSADRLLNVRCVRTGP